jgi:hypothetical protein
VRLGLPVGLQKKRSKKFSVHAGGGADNGGEKRNVLIVSVLLHEAIDLALRCKAQRQQYADGILRCAAICRGASMSCG